MYFILKRHICSCSSWKDVVYYLRHLLIALSWHLWMLPFAVMLRNSIPLLFPPSPSLPFPFHSLPYFPSLSPFMLKLTIFSFSLMQPFEGWMLICDCYFMSIYWISNINVVPICWSWWTLFFEPASLFNFTRSIVHLSDKFAACFRVLFAVKGTLHHTIR